jgi:hypothetical protein
MSEAITTAQARALLASPIDSRATPTPPTLTDSPSVAMCAACAAKPQGCGWADDRPGLPKNTARLAISAHLCRQLANHSGQAPVMTARVAGWCLPLVLSVGRAGSLQRGLDVVSGAPVQRWERWQGAGAGLSCVVPFRGVRMLWDGRGDGGTEAFRA